MLIRTPIALAALVLFGVAHAQGQLAKTVKEEVSKTEAVIKAELSKPVGTPLAAEKPAAEPVVQGGNRFITRAGTGTSKTLRAAPPVTLPEGPLGKVPADMQKLIGDAQRAGGMPLDPYQKEINLPGLKRDDPSVKPFVVHTRNGVNEIVRLSGRLLNRIATPFSKPVVITDQGGDLAPKVVGSDVYFQPVGDAPIGMYIVDGTNTAQTISLTVIPVSDIPGQNLIVKLEDLRTVDSLVATTAGSDESEMSSARPTDYTGSIQRLMKQAVRGQVKGFATVPIEGGVAKMGPIEVTPEFAFTGATVDIYRYAIKNVSDEQVDLAETAFYRRGVKAVSFFPNLGLKPGETGYVFLMAEKPKAGQAGAEVDR